MNRFLFYCFLCLASLSCTVRQPGSSPGIKSLKYAGSFSLPHKMQFNGTTVGGLSSIDYSPADSLYYLICDDRSDIDPARYYTARFHLSSNGIDTVQLVDVVTLKQANGLTYPSHKKNPQASSDPEAMRLATWENRLYWTSEGERLLTKRDTILQHPAVNIIALDGRWVDSLPLPENMKMTSRGKGPRRNGAFEGIDFNRQTRDLFISMEEPLYEDSHRSGLGDTTGWVRILHYTDHKKLPRQYAYQLDPVVKAPSEPGGFRVNGISDILALDESRLLVTERSFSTGNRGSNIRVYLAELQGASDVAGVTSLQNEKSLKPVRKKLVLDMDRLGIFIDNIEGATFGPRLANGKQSILFVADDNFSPSEINQFLLFEVE